MENRIKTDVNNNPITNTKTIITGFNNRNEFLNALQVNPGVIILKFGAEWCGPCKTIESLVYENFQTMPENVICADIDIDQNFDIYTFLKSKRMVNGIPAILAYYSDNTSYVPSDSVIGADISQIQNLFNGCLKYANKM
tara:strand:+ start:337 stop:753 length:417 start_codon:yes stop_codon:yes gene_type:complete